MDTAVEIYNPGVLTVASMTRTSLEIPDNLSFGDWGQMMRQLALMEGAVHWWIGDALVYAGKRYGETYTEAEALTGFSIETLKIDKHVAFQIEKLSRNNFLSWSHHKAVAPLEPDEQRHWLNLAQQHNWSVAELRKHLKMPHVSQNSGNNEWYTPPRFIEAARQVMGEIDLDPASSDVANKTVQAATYYTQEDDGLQHDWYGRVWMNPPYASPLIGQFSDKLVEHVSLGGVTEACVLVNNATETAWFGAMLDVADCVCFIKTRVKFLDIDGNPSGAPLQGQAMLYVGPNWGMFGQVFSEFGRILYAWRDSEQKQGAAT